MSHPARIVLFLAAAFATSVSLRADITLPVAGPPQADAVNARVRRGGEVAIELRAHYGGAGTVVFGIVNPPRHGKLSRLQTGGGNHATITYAHVGSHPETTDEFSYVVQAGGRTSSPAEVRIEVEDLPAQLQTSNELDFGEVMAGEKALRELPITNAGGGMLQGKITVSSPWRIAPADYRLAAGQTATVRVAFQPNEAKSFVGQITLTDVAGNSTTVALRGTANPALRVSPSPLLFGAEPRRETISLTNLTAAAVKLSFETSPNLEPIAELALAAGEEKEVPVAVRPAVRGPLHENLTIAGPGFIVLLLIEVPALPEKIAATVAPAAVDVAAPTASPVLASVAPRPAPPPPSTVEVAPPASETHPYVKVTPRHLEASLWELKWPAGKIRPASYRIEERSVSLDHDGALQTAWSAVTASLNSSADLVIAKISGLSENHVHTLRVTALGEDGTTLWESPALTLAAAPVVSHERALWLTGLWLVLAIFFLLRWRARVRPA